MPRSDRPFPWQLALVLAATVLTVAAAASPAHTLAQAAQMHPARIHAGVCDSLGPVLFELTALGAPASPDGTPVSSAGAVGSAQAMPLLVSETSLEITLSDLVAEDHAIAVAASEQEPDELLACGEIGGPLIMQMAGMVMPGDELAVGLAAPGQPGMAGLALIRAEGKTATVRVYLGDG